MIAVFYSVWDAVLLIFFYFSYFFASENFQPASDNGAEHANLLLTVIPLAMTFPYARN